MAMLSLVDVEVIQNFSHALCYYSTSEHAADNRCVQ